MSRAAPVAQAVAWREPCAAAWQRARAASPGGRRCSQPPSRGAQTRPRPPYPGHASSCGLSRRRCLWIWPGVSGAGPEALPTLSLPNICGLAASLSVPGRRSDHPVRCRDGHLPDAGTAAAVVDAGRSRVWSWSSLCSVIAFVQTTPGPGEFSCGWIMSTKPAYRPRRWPGPCGTLRLSSGDAPGGRLPRAAGIRHEAGWPSPLSLRRRAARNARIG